MLQFEGDRDFRQAPAVVWARLADARFLAACVPDVEKTGRVDADAAALTIRPGLAFVRGTLDVEMQVGDRAEPTSVRVRLRSRGVGSSSTVEATLTLAAQGEGTRVHWGAAVTELGGLLKLVPGGLIRGAAAKVIDDVWGRIAARLDAEGGGA